MPSRPVLSELCSIALDQLKSGSVSKSKFSKAAAALQVDASELEAAVNALAHVLLECARRSASEDDMVNSVDELSFSDASKAALRSCYSGSAKELRALLADTASLRLPHYHNAEWRLDVSLGTRHCRNALTPSILLQLETRDMADLPQQHMLQLDYANLDHLVQQLEQAVKESNSKHARRILRYVK